MDKWVCQRCGNERVEKPRKNEICNKNGCKGRFKQLRLCRCGRWFYTNDPNKRYCSAKCDAKEEHSVKLTCEYCGTVFNRAKSNCKQCRHHFCSKDCFVRYNERPKAERICKYCGKVFSVYKSALENTNATGNYCSRECYYKSMEIAGASYYRADFGRVKKRYFSGVQFCALCGTTKNIHIHHIIPFRLTEDNCKDNLIPLCSKHHIQFERASRPFIKMMDSDLELAKLMLNNILQERQMATHTIVKQIVNQK